jgi:hypothetical protein
MTPDGITMDRLFLKIYLLALLAFAETISAFELLSEGAMGTVSAISANSAEEIVSVAGSTAAGLRIDDDYERLPFQTSVSIDASETDDGSSELDFALTQEVENWAESLLVQDSSDGIEAQIGYVDELPPSSFDDAVFLIRDDEFDSIIFEPNDSDQEDSTIYELGRVEQTVITLEQNIDSIEYNVIRRVEFAATIDAYIGDPNTASVGSGYITDLSSRSNVRIATVRD